MTSGFPLFVLICLLATAPLYSRTLGQLAVGALFVLWIFTLTSIKQHAAESTRRPNPGRRQGRPQREMTRSES